MLHTMTTIILGLEVISQLRYTSTYTRARARAHTHTHTYKEDYYMYNFGIVICRLYITILQFLEQSHLHCTSVLQFYKYLVFFFIYF